MTLACQVRSRDWHFNETCTLYDEKIFDLSEMKSLFHAMTHFYSNNPKILLQGIIEINLSVATLILSALFPYLKKEHFEMMHPKEVDRGGFFTIFNDWEQFFMDKILPVKSNPCTYTPTHLYFVVFFRFSLFLTFFPKKE